jgi:hypothetical protein
MFCVYSIQEGTAFGIRVSKTYKIMLTIILFLAMLFCCWFIFKTIDWFEKI